MKNQVPTFEDFTSESKDSTNEINEADSRYFQIKIKNIKSDLDAIQHWVDTDDSDRASEYIDDQIKTLKELKKKL